MKKFYSFEEFIKDLDKLTKDISSFAPDCLLAIARGGMTIGHFLAERLNTREIYTLNAISYENDKKIGKPKIFNIPDLSNKKRVLLIDDISDSGETLEEVIKVLEEKYPKLEIKTATIFYKKHTKIMPNFTIKEAKEWIVFFWDNEGQKLANKELL